MTTPDDALSLYVWDVIAREVSPSTLRAYRSDWEHFQTWCEKKDLTWEDAAPATVAAYLRHHINSLKSATLRRRIGAITCVHSLMPGWGLPTSGDAVLVVLRSLEGDADRKVPIGAHHVRGMVRLMSDTPIGIRDRAMLLVTFAGGLRRGEMSGVDIGAVCIHDAGCDIYVKSHPGWGRRERKDQESAITVRRGGTLCPVDALEKWLAVSGATEGPVFTRIDRHGTLHGDRISGRAVAQRFKLYAEMIGLDPRGIGAQSLRIGLVRELVRAGVDPRLIMSHARVHFAQILDYIQDMELPETDITRTLGL